MQKKETSNISTRIGLAYNCQVNIFSARNECVRFCERGKECLHFNSFESICVVPANGGEHLHGSLCSLSLAIQFETNKWMVAAFSVSVIILLKDGNVCLMNGPKRIGFCLWKWLLVLAPDNKRRVAKCWKCSNYARKHTRPHRFHMDKEKTEH